MKVYYIYILKSTQPRGEAFFWSWGIYDTTKNNLSAMATRFDGKPNKIYYFDSLFKQTNDTLSSLYSEDII